MLGGFVIGITGIVSALPSTTRLELVPLQRDDLSWKEKEALEERAMEVSVFLLSINRHEVE
jgi:hypothetical protein